MPTPMIYNSVASADMNVVEMIDPNLIQFYATSLADQFNKFRMSYAPQKRVRDLADYITDVIIETTVQGSSLLEVHIIDPAWTLFQRDKDGVSFIDVDDTGYLWPPVEVTYPPNISDATWRLCECRPSTDLNQANVILVFEDKIVSELREHSGAKSSHANETRAEFIQELVTWASKHPAYPGEVKIRFQHLLPHETFTTADLSSSQQTPTSATQPFPPKARKHPDKRHKKPPPSTATGGWPFVQQRSVSGPDLSIATGMNSVTSLAFTNPFSPIAFPPLANRPANLP